MGIALARTTPQGLSSPGSPTTRHNPSQDVTGSGNARCDGDADLIRAQAAGAFTGGSAGWTDTQGRSWTPVTLPDGTPYPGDLVADILHYRKLRARTLSGISLGRKLRGHFEGLEQRLRSHDDPFERGSRPPRAYHRFEYQFSARVRFEHSTDGTANIVETQVANLSAGGVKLADAPDLEVGQKAWFVFEHGRRTITLPARVAWKQDGSAGLMFAGAPSWS